jgi:hypothetical protein
MCITAVINNAPMEAVFDYASRLFDLFKKFLKQSECLSAPIMIITLATLVKVMA